MSELKKLDVNALEEVAGGNSGFGRDYWVWVEVRAPQGGDVPLRSHPINDDGNIVARIKGGEKITVNPDKKSGNYIWAYDPQSGLQGWVGSGYVKGAM